MLQHLVQGRVADLLLAQHLLLLVDLLQLHLRPRVQGRLYAQGLGLLLPSLHLRGGLGQDCTGGQVVVFLAGEAGRQVGQVLALGLVAVEHRPALHLLFIII